VVGLYGGVALTPHSLLSIIYSVYSLLVWNILYDGLGVWSNRQLAFWEIKQLGV
jgi:hypothetical protein